MTRIAHFLVVGFAAPAILLTACARSGVLEAASPVLPTDHNTEAVTRTTDAPEATTTTWAASRAIRTAGETSTAVTTTTAAPTAATTTTTTATEVGVVPPMPEPFVVAPGEVHPGAKQLAGTVAQRLTTYAPTASLTDIATSLARRDGERRTLEEAMEPLFHAGHWSRGTVLYPQLGGLSGTGTSVMVVIRQEIGTGDTTTLVETRTLDIRLRLEDGEWEFAELASAGGTPVPRPDDLDAAAAAVLDDPRILLPDSARWDIHRGHTSPTLLHLMSDLADVTPYAVTVLATGHPYHVFDTDRTSKHTVGRAVDVYLLGADLVIDDREKGSFTFETLQWLYAVEDVYKLGGPWALDGRGGRSFTDIVHQDHLHISVSD